MYYQMTDKVRKRFVYGIFPSFFGYASLYLPHMSIQRKNTMSAIMCCNRHMTTAYMDFVRSKS